VIKRGPITLLLPERKAFVDGREVELTSKEFTLLLILIQNEDKEVPYETIYQHVWGVTMNNNVCALRQQILRLRKKLDEENANDFYIINEHGKGYVFTTMQ
jgi:DNA-binding response OmpR family regulator